MSDCSGETYVQHLLGGRKATWYHASNLDGRPIMCLRALVNWNFGSDEDNATFQRIGQELRDTARVYNEYSDRVYRKLLDCWKQSTKNEGRRMPMQLFDSVDCSHATIEPFQIFTEVERATYMSKYGSRNRDLSDAREYDGFTIKLPWFKSLPDLCDTIIFFCLDDFYVKEMFDNNGITVVAFFEHDAGTEGSPGFMSLYKTAEDAHNIKYLFTDSYNYCDNFENYLLCNLHYSTVWDSFVVKNFIGGRRKLRMMPTLLPEHDPNNNSTDNDYCDICKKREHDFCRMGRSVVKNDGGFCIAIRKNIL